MLRAIEHGLRILAWHDTKDATLKAPQNRPVHLPLTPAEVTAQKPEREKYDASTIAEMNEFLGWSA